MKKNYEEYLYRLSRDECTEEEKRELACWMEASDEHRRESEVIGSIIRDSPRLRGRERLDKDQAWQRVRRRTKKTSFLMRLARYAASICLPFLIVVIYLLARPGAPGPESHENLPVEPGTTRATLYLSDGQSVDLRDSREAPIVDSRAAREIAFDEATNTLNYHDTTRVAGGNPATHKIIVPRGGEYPLTLPDGTRVWLNAETEITFPLAFGPGSREIRLRGEAFFEVKKERDRPFIVHVREARVEVTGTSFNLACYPDDAVITTLESGSVSFITGHHARRLTEGEQATYNPRTGAIAVEKVDVKYHSSWRHGRFHFYDTPLREIAEKLGRWYDVRFEFADSSLEELRFSGAALRAKPIEFMLELLEHTRSLRFTTLPGRVIRVEQK
jgi:ferric-dicitrate binding protein FerR (iron transport regulator)